MLAFGWTHPVFSSEVLHTSRAQSSFSSVNNYFTGLCSCHAAHVVSFTADCVFCRKPSHVALYWMRATSQNQLYEFLIKTFRKVWMDNVVYFINLFIFSILYLNISVLRSIHYKFVCSNTYNTICVQQMAHDVTAKCSYNQRRRVSRFRRRQMCYLGS